MQDRMADIVAFVRAVDAKSFTLAGERLGVSRSAVGKSVARLELRLGVRLLHRTTRTLSLSQEGAEFYERCVRILHELEEAELAVTGHGGAPSGVLRLDLPQTFGRRYVLPLMTDYLQRWPSVSVSATFSDRFTDLVAEGVDLAIRIGGEGDSCLVGKVLARNRFVVCGSPAYLAERGVPKTPADLPGHECLTFLSAGQPLEWRFQEDGRPWTLPVPGRLRAGNAEALRDAAIAGAGLVQLDTYIAGEDIRAGRLVPVLEPFAAEGPPIRAVYPSRRYLAPKVRHFIDMAAAAWKDAPWERP